MRKYMQIGTYLAINRQIYADIYLNIGIIDRISGLYWILKNRVYDVNKELRTLTFGGAK